MKSEVIKTADGSSTIYLEEWNEHYHSKHGAIQEAQHVFISEGFKYITTGREKMPIHILEMGFGTGLNALLTAFETGQKTTIVHYTAIEGFPVEKSILKTLNYTKVLSTTHSEIFNKIHDADWEKDETITSNFSLKKIYKSFEEVQFNNDFDLIYFDAFGSRVQPTLWERPMLTKMYDALRPNGVFVTYSAKGSVRRCLAELGFEVERLDGPPGKRHMLRAKKKSLI